MEATNSLNIFTPTQTRVAEVATPPKLNPPSLKVLLHIVSPKLLPFALSLSGNLADAEDLCQATILKLIENKDKFLSAEYPLAFIQKPFYAMVLSINAEKILRLIPLMS